MRALDASLRRLGTDYVDLYQLHSWDADTPIDETLQALDDVVRSRSGTSGAATSWPIGGAQRRPRRGVGDSQFRQCAAPLQSAVPRERRELLPLCAEEGIAVIPTTHLPAGSSSGKHQPGAPTEGGRFRLGWAAGRYQERYWNDRMFKTIDDLRPIAESAGVSMATMAVQWVLANPTITSPIVGASRPEQLRDSVVAVDAPLDPAIKAQLDELTYEFPLRRQRSLAPACRQGQRL
jgi:aryl-alcohol dehydrogenase (NADP+)